MTFITMAMKFHTFKCNIKGDVLAQKIFMNIARFASLFLCITCLKKNEIFVQVEDTMTFI